MFASESPLVFSVKWELGNRGRSLRTFRTVWNHMYDDAIPTLAVALPHVKGDVYQIATYAYPSYDLSFFVSTPIAFYIIRFSRDT